MRTTLINAKRKNIDIKADTFRTLSIRAAEQGINLKKYIETLLDKLAEDDEDLLLYNKCVKNNPECREYLNENEQAAFEKEMREKLQKKDKEIQKEKEENNSKNKNE